MKKAIGLLLIICLCTIFCGCAVISQTEEQSSPQNPTDPEKEKDPTVVIFDPTGKVVMLNQFSQETFSDEALGESDLESAYQSFAVDFLQTVSIADSDNNLCVSPLSAYMAFSLCFAGSDGETAAQFEEVFGLSKEDAARYCQALYAAFLQKEYRDENTKVNLANSVWINQEDAPYVKESYLQDATDYFNAPVYRCDFSDKETVDAVNQWCSDNTDGLIKEIVKEFDKDQIMALINALLVEAAWLEPYQSNQVREYTFRNRDDSETTVEFLCRKISSYYASEDAQAFKMPLCDGFSFVGILPDEGVSIDEYIASLTADKLSDLLEKPRYDRNVYTRIPKFSLDCDMDLSEVMPAMGLTAAFDPASADFKPMVEIPGANVYIGTAKQKTHFELDDKGIKAAAITYIALNKATAFLDEKQNLYLYLDRPFVYMLMDESTGLPLFIGAIRTME